MYRELEAKEERLLPRQPQDQARDTSNQHKIANDNALSALLARVDLLLIKEAVHHRGVVRLVIRDPLHRAALRVHHPRDHPHPPGRQGLPRLQGDLLLDALHRCHPRAVVIRELEEEVEESRKGVNGISIGRVM